MDPIIIIVYKSNDENEAFNEEIRLIALYGRHDLGLGPLTNLTDGGEGTIGIQWTEEMRKHKSESQTGEKNHRYGKTVPDQSKRMTGKKNIMYGKKGILHPSYGKPAHNTKLSDDQVYSIRKSTKKITLLAKEFKVSIGVIYNIRSGRSYSRVVRKDLKL